MHLFAAARAGAEAADLLWFVGGDEQVVNDVKPVLEPCGPEVFRLGPVGAGMAGKAVNNFLLWAAVVADREALELADHFDIDTQTLIAGLLRSSGMNQFLNLHGTIDRFPWAHKDMKIVSAMSDEVQLSMPLAGMLRELVKPIMIETACGDLITP
jgi:3-hydroxyisobutyrate dehydrogenase-like beta-hydroxyacid dehydrogenase